MSRSILFIAAAFSFSIANAQKEDKVFEKIELEAHTDARQWADHISRKIQLHDSVLRNIPPGSYPVKIQFIIDVHGNLGQIKAMNDPGYGLAQKAVNSISTYKGKWQSANQCGRNVKAYRTEVITFAISDQ